jgi:membrane dipeptidase
MSLKKNYGGYRSFQYLEAGKDYKPFDLAREVDRVEPFLLPLTKEEEARV